MTGGERQPARGGKSPRKIRKRETAWRKRRGGLHAEKPRKQLRLSCGFFAGLHFLDFLADLLSFLLDLIHCLAYARAGRFILFVVELLEIFLECGEQILQFFETV